MLISQLISQFGLEPASPPGSDFEIRGVRPLTEAGEGDLSFLSNKKYKAQVLTTGASAILIKEPMDGCPALQLLCDNPYATLARVLQALYPEPEAPEQIHPTAVVSPGAVIGKGVHIGPWCVVGAGAIIGNDCELVSHISVASGCQLGEKVKLFPNVVLYPGCRIGNRVRIHANTVVGSDGFGYAQDKGVHVKVPQIGGVVIEDDVEIGSNVSIDRGALHDTHIGAGSKIDNMVQVGHGVKIGKGAILVSHTGISGSAEIGNYSVLAGKVGVTGHIKIGDQVVVMGDSVVTKNLDKPGQYAGNPAIPHMQYQRQLAELRGISKLKKRIKKLEEAQDE